MAISLVGYGFNTQTTTSIAHSVTLPGGIQDGDYGLLCVEYTGTVVPAPVTNGQSWTRLGSQTGTSVVLSVYGKTMLASDSQATATYSFTANTKSIKSVSVFRGVLAVDTSIAAAGGAASTIVTMPGLTPNSPDDWLIGNAACRYSASGGGVGVLPSGTTLIVDALEPTTGIHYEAIQTYRALTGGAGVAQVGADISMQGSQTNAVMTVALSPVPSTKYHGWGQPIAALPA